MPSFIWQMQLLLLGIFNCIADLITAADPRAKGGDRSELGALLSTPSALLGPYCACQEGKSCISSCHTFLQNPRAELHVEALQSIFFGLCSSFLTQIRAREGSSVSLQLVCFWSSSCVLTAGSVLGILCATAC